MITRTTIHLFLLTILVHSGFGQPLPNAVRLNSDAEIVNTIFWRNSNINAVSADVPVNHSALDSMVPGGTGNIRLLGNPFTVGYRINSSSPAYNTGTIGPLRLTDTLDLDYFKRVNCDNVDMGAYEYQVVRTTILHEPEDLHLCIGNPGTLSVVAEGANLTYQWQKDGINILGATSATLRILGNSSDAGLYRVLIFGDCCDTISRSARVDIEQKPVLTLSSGETTITTGGSFNLNDLIASSTGTVSWFATNPIRPVDPLVTNITQTQTFIAVETGDVCPDEAMQTVVIVVDGMPCILRTGGTMQICEGESIRLTMDTAFVNYKWIIAETGEELERYSWFTPTSSVKLVAMSTCGQCEDTLMVNVHIVPFEVMSDILVCGEYGGTEVQLLSLPAADAWYREHDGKEEYVGKGLPFVTIENNTQNVFIAKFHDGICEATRRVSIDAFPPKIRMSAPDTLICEGESVFLTTNIDHLGIVEWRLKGSNDQINPLVRPDVTTTYRAWVINEKCGDVFAEFTVTVQPKPIFNILNPPSSRDTIVHLMASPMANFWTSSDGVRLTNPITVTDDPTTYIGYYDYGVCRVSASITISLSEPEIHLIDVESHIFCHNDGWAYVVITGTSGPYTIEWQDEGKTGAVVVADTITGLTSGGTYTVIVTDRYKRSVEKTFTVENILPITVTREIIQPTNDSCNNGMVIVSVSGGTNPNNYVFEFCGGAIVKGETTWMMENVGAYVHWMIVHDGMQGCVADTAYFGVFCLDVIPGTECFNCTGCSDVTVIIGEVHNDAHPHPAPQPFTAVVWRNGSMIDSITDLMTENFVIPNLGSGTYTVRVYDRFRSYVEREVTIVQPSPIELEITLVQPRNRDCNDGRIELIPSGGAGSNFTFEFNNGTIADGQEYTLHNAEAGVHMLTVSDAWGCFIDTNIVLPCLNSRAMPNIFISPNNDGKNDYVKIRDIHHFPRNRVIFFNTYGEIVNEIIDYNNDIPERRWAGRNRRNQLLPDGVYYYIVEVEGLPPMGGWVYMVISRHN